MRDMTKGAPLGHLFFYAVPLLLGNWLQLAYNAVDSIIAGRFIGQDALAAEGIAGPPADETPPAPAQPAAQQPAAVSADTGVSTYTPQDSPAQPPQSGDDGRRYIICPKCGERICL